MHRSLIRSVLGALLLLTVAAPMAQAKHLPPPFRPPEGWPKYVLIPRFGVRAPVEDLGLFSPQDVHAPFQWGDVAWYKWGFRPGELGRAVIFGHVDSTCCPAVFWHLKDLVPGDHVQVQYRAGKPLTFVVMWTHVYLNSQLPTKFLFAPAHEHGMSLVTCTGIFHRDGTGYDHKTVVYTRLLLPNGKLG